MDIVYIVSNLLLLYLATEPLSKVRHDYNSGEIIGSAVLLQLIRTVTIIL
jgi:hypothetical protein